jgi:hypothetical protein
MYVTNTETIPGKAIVEHFGIDQGITVRAKHRASGKRLPPTPGGSICWLPVTAMPAAPSISWRG